MMGCECFMQKKVELALRQSTTDEHEVSSNDYVGKVLGNEHPGTVRCLGFGAAPSSSCRQKRLCLGGVNFSSNNDGSYFHECQEKYNQCQEAYNQCQERYNQCKEKYNQLMNALKAYMIMKEGKIPEQFAGIFDSPPITVTLEFFNVWVSGVVGLVLFFICKRTKQTSLHFYLLLSIQKIFIPFIFPLLQPNDAATVPSMDARSSGGSNSSGSSH